MYLFMMFMLVHNLYPAKFNKIIYVEKKGVMPRKDTCITLYIQTFGGTWIKLYFNLFTNNYILYYS